MLQVLLMAKPENPRQFLLNYLQQEETDNNELSEADLQSLFLVSQRITGKINPQETIGAFPA